VEEGAGERPTVVVDLGGGATARGRDTTLGEESCEVEVVLARAQR
jgi:hypothetical protein